MFNYFLTLPIFIVFSCTDSTFQGESSTKKQEKVSKQDDTIVVSTGEENTVEKNDETKNLEVNIESQAVSEVLKKECTANLDYDPLEINCSVPVKSSLWYNHPEWSTATRAITDEDAHWISPLAGNYGCPPVPSSEKLIFVSYIQANKTGDYTVESVNDNAGSVRLWKNADPDNEVLNLTTIDAKYNTGKASLEKKLYTIVIESQDYGSYSAVIFSMKDPQGTIVRHTKQGDPWCILRVSAATDIKTFVPAALACKDCMVGP